MMARRLCRLALCGIALSLAACPLSTPKPGSDRDEHGCLGSGAYTWCEKEQQCVRSWELARKRGLDENPAAFGAYCSGH